MSVPHHLPPLTLIEASAGTGKTYRLIQLCLELILTHGLGVEQLLIVTFTRAATREIAWRLRQRLCEAQIVWRSGTSADPLLQQLVLSSAEAGERLARALRDLDQAAVMTLDGFCQWVLRRYPLLSGQALDFEVMADERPLMRQILEDFWRRQLYAQDPIWSQWVLENNWSPTVFLNSAGDWARAN